MVEFSDLFDDEGDVFQKKAKVGIASQKGALVSRTPPLHLRKLTAPSALRFDYGAVEFARFR